MSLFREEWRLTRSNEPGLSVVAPFVPEELKPERLLQAVAVHFFTRIVRGELVVNISGPGMEDVELSAGTIAAACSRVKWDGPKRTKRHTAPPVVFAQECLTSGLGACTQVLGTERVPELSEAALAEDELHRLRQEFSAGERIGVRVRLSLPRRVGGSEIGELDVHLQRDPDGARRDTYYVREGMTITKLNSQAAHRGIQALVFVESGPLAELLGDTEGPAHEDWDTSNAERADRVWKAWKGRVNFVRRIADGLVELLTPPATEPDFDLLSDFFSIDKVNASQRQRQPGKDSKSPARMEPIVATPKWFHIHARSGGFTVGRNGSVPLPDAAALRVSVAYDMPQGDPLRNWSHFDFRIGSGDGCLHPTGRGADAKLIRGNAVVLRNIGDDFTFSVDGFDRRRDLFVRVDDISADTETNDD